MKAQVDFQVVDNVKLARLYSLLTLRLNDTDTDFDFSEVLPGQFVQVRIDGSRNTMLRRPISINFVDKERKEISLLVRNAGEGTAWLCGRSVNDVVNLILPLGRGFSLGKSGDKPLLVGGGVGVAPLLYLGKVLAEKGVEPTFLLAAKTAGDLLLKDEFSRYGEVYVSTDDGSEGAPGLVTLNPILNNSWSMIYCCGPKPMMHGIADIARKTDTPCEVSLENSMACGLGACLCCVEDTKEHGNVCVCTEGPVFSIEDLKW